MGNAIKKWPRIGELRCRGVAAQIAEEGSVEATPINAPHPGSSRAPSNELGAPPDARLAYRASNEAQGDRRIELPSAPQPRRATPRLPLVQRAARRQDRPSTNPFSEYFPSPARSTTHLPAPSFLYRRTHCTACAECPNSNRPSTADVDARGICRGGYAWAIRSVRIDAITHQAATVGRGNDVALVTLRRFGETKGVTNKAVRNQFAILSATPTSSTCDIWHQFRWP